MGHVLRRRLGRVHNRDVLRRHSPQQRLDQRIMRAAKHQHVGIVCVVRKTLRQINLRHLLRHRMFHPSLFDQWHKQRTRLLPHRDPAGFERPPVSMAADGGLCSNDDHLLLPAGRRRGFRSRFDDADHCYICRSFDLVERERCGCVAGDYQQLRSLILQIAHRADRVMRDRGRRLRSVRKAGRVAEVEIVSLWDSLDQCPENG